MSQRDWSGVGELQALLGTGAEFEGKLVFQGRVRLDGRFKGEIRSDDVLILGGTAEVDAAVNVGALIVRGGTLRGDVRASQLVEIYAPAKVQGNIEAPQVYLEKGAVFEGQCTMTQEKPAAAEAAAETRAPDLDERAVPT